MKLPVIAESKGLNIFCWTVIFNLSIYIILFIISLISFKIFFSDPCTKLLIIEAIVSFIFLPIAFIYILVETILIKKGKIKKITLTISKKLSRFLISLVFIMLLAFYAFIYCLIFVPPQRSFCEIKDYNKIITKINKQDGIAHFPKSIPENAKDPQVWAFIGGIQGEFLLLKFEIDKDYIQKELKRHKFLNANTPIGTKQKLYGMYTDNGRITSENFTFYVLDEPGNYPPESSYFPYFNGIAVDKELKHILYYHILPDD